MLAATTVADEVDRAEADYTTGDAGMEDIAVCGPAWNKWEIGPEVFMYQYKEPNVMDLDGVLYGIDGRFTRYIPRVRKVTVGRGDDAVVTEKDYMLVLRADGRYAMGTHDYDGALQDGTPKKISGIDATSYELRGLVGYSPQVHPDYMTVFYAGFGIRYKDDDSSFDPAGYKRESTYMYLPFLIEHTRTLLNGCELSFALEYDLFLSGEQVSDLGVVKITNTQNTGNGYRASVAYAGTTDSGIGWKIEPFVRYWDIDDSEWVYVRDGFYLIGFVEPENNTLELGISARVVF